MSLSMIDFELVADASMVIMIMQAAQIILLVLLVIK
jgi:hypothetical protein